jgi:hypothetical protein
MSTKTSKRPQVSVKANPVYACGHQEVIYLSGTEMVCRRKLVTTVKNPCSACLAVAPELTPAEQRSFRARIDSIHADHEAWRTRNPDRSLTWDRH